MNEIHRKDRTYTMKMKGVKDLKLAIWLGYYKGIEEFSIIFEANCKEFYSKKFHRNEVQDSAEWAVDELTQIAERIKNLGLTDSDIIIDYLRDKYKYKE